MNYKVSYYTFAILDNGKIGNTTKEISHIFINSNLEDIPIKLNKFLKEKQRIGFISKIEEASNECI